MSTEIIILIVSVLGALTSLVAAIASSRRDDVRLRTDISRFEIEEEERRRAIDVSVSEDTIGLYKRLSTQYQTITEKDKKLLRTVSFVIRKMLVLERTVTDLSSEIEAQMEGHSSEADNMNCPYYEIMSSYIYVRLGGIEQTVRETMEEINLLLLNGNGHSDQ